MAVLRSWPRPPKWPIQPGTVDPGQRWVWHTRPRLIIPIWEHASALTNQRHRRLRYSSGAVAPEHLPVDAPDQVPPGAESADH